LTEELSIARSLSHASWAAALIAGRRTVRRGPDPAPRRAQSPVARATFALVRIGGRATPWRSYRQFTVSWNTSTFGTPLGSKTVLPFWWKLNVEPSAFTPRPLSVKAP
jgi:hypothetical protein